MSAEPWAAAPLGADDAPASLDHIYHLHVELGESAESKAEVHLLMPFAFAGIRSLRLRTRSDESQWVDASARLAKRALDVFAAASILLLTLPVMAVVAAAIKATSAGPIIYRHPRIGRFGRTFEVWKFRSMRTDLTLDDIAEHIENDEAKAESPVYKSPNDPRITWIGRWIRRTALDELPQLLNVLGGSMSLVGPRPLVADELAELPSPQAHLRQSVSPGVTGLWQVARRAEMSFEERLQLDLLYVSCRRLWLDLILLAMTPVALLRGERSY